MRQALTIVQIVDSLVLIFLILIQARGTGFGRGASGGSFSRRGLEKFIFKATIVSAIIFLGSSILSLLV